MILVAIVCAAIASQAASFNWKTGTGQNVYLMNSTDRAASVMAYLFDTATYSQTEVVNAFAGGTFGELASLSKVTTTTAGAITTALDGNTFSYGSVGDTLSAFFAIVVDDNIFVSTIASGEGMVSGSTTLSFTDTKNPSQLAATKWQSGMTASAGWYTTSVPEPTSGLLMLLGMAGLVLRRRRA